jgi:tetratricopeptide (TPR) repeat protein
MFIYYMQLAKKAGAELLLELGRISPDEELEIRTAWVYQVSIEGVERIKTEAAHLLALLETDKDRQVIALDSLACIPVYGGPAELLDDALAWIERALAEKPDMITLKGTKGSLLFEKGNVEEGLRLLEEVLEKTGSDGDRAICKYYMALHHHRRSELQLAYRWLREAQEIGLQSPVKSRVENELSGMRETSIS